MDYPPDHPPLMRPVTEGRGLSQKERKRWNTFNGPQHDPGDLAAQRGGVHFNRTLGRVLMPDSLMPTGPHARKTMRQVPADYLLWLQAQPWARHWPAISPVLDYLDRFPIENPGTYGWPTHIAYVTPMQACTPSQFWPGTDHALLTCHADTLLHEDKYHTFALGALGLNPQNYHPDLRAYRLTLRRRELAIRHGAYPLQPRERTPHPTQERPCTKFAYPSHRAAEAAAHDILTSRRRNRPTYHRAYPCPQCGFHHLTSRKLPHEQ